MKSPDRFVIGSNHQLDKGGEFARALERRGVAFEVVDLSKRFPSPEKIGAIIALGSPYENSAAQTAWYGDLIKAGTPGVGVCVAHQGMGEALGGRVTAASEAEYGFVSKKGRTYRPRLTFEGASDSVLGPVMNNHPEGVVFEFHNAQVKVNPETTIVIAKGRGDVVQALRAKKLDGTPGRMLGVQFHPEVSQPEDLEVFLAIYEEVFDLTKDRQNYLREQYEQYHKSNVGSLLVDQVIDNIVEGTEAIAA